MDRHSIQYFKGLALIVLSVMMVFIPMQAKSQGEIMKITLLKEMFTNMVIKKDASLIPKYYHEDMLLYSNGKVMNYNDFITSHQDYYKTQIEYAVEYDSETLIEQGETVAGRVWITTKRPGEDKKEIEVMLIAQYMNNKIYRLWELTYPDWSKLPAFQEPEQPRS